jgi:hypothetical protein
VLIISCCLLLLLLLYATLWPGRFKFNTNFFQPDVTYSDGFWSFTGSAKYRQAFWAREALTKPHAVRGCAKEQLCLQETCRKLAGHLQDGVSVAAGVEAVLVGSWPA